MKRRGILAMGTAAALLAACKSLPGMKDLDPVIGAVSSQLGVTETQAGGGLGSLLSLAKTKLSAQDFSAVTKAIPGADGYMKTAQQALGGASITDMTSVKTAFAKLGMSPEMVNQFKPILLETAGKLGGPSVKQLLASALA